MLDDTREPERLLLPGEVAATFRVTTQTLRRWAAAGKLHAINVAGQRRYKAAEVEALLRGEGR